MARKVAHHLLRVVQHEVSIRTSCMRLSMKACTAEEDTFGHEHASVRTTGVGTRPSHTSQAVRTTAGDTKELKITFSIAPGGTENCLRNIICLFPQDQTADLNSAKEETFCNELCVSKVTSRWTSRVIASRMLDSLCPQRVLRNFSASRAKSRHTRLFSVKDGGTSLTLLARTRQAHQPNPPPRP